MNESFWALREDEQQYLQRVRGTSLHKRCPLESQGEIIEAVVIETGEKIAYCDECDSVWRSADPLDEDHAAVFQTFHDANGRRGLTADDIRVA